MVDEAGKLIRDPVALRHVLRIHVKKLIVFCQASGMGAPPPDQLSLFGGVDRED